jgi:hypothetical protein
LLKTADQPPLVFRASGSGTTFLVAPNSNRADRASSMAAKTISGRSRCMGMQADHPGAKAADARIHSRAAVGHHNSLLRFVGQDRLAVVKPPKLWTYCFPTL